MLRNKCFATNVLNIKYLVFAVILTFISVST